MSDLIGPELVAVLRRLKLSLILPTLPDRLALARQHKLPYQDLLLTVLADEVSRRDSNAVAVRAAKARLDPAMRLERWDDTARVTFDRALLQELASASSISTSTSRSSAPSVSGRRFSPMPSATSPVPAAPPSSPSAPIGSSRRSAMRASITPSKPRCGA